jgi:hypothetical protein
MQATNNFFHAPNLATDFIAQSKLKGLWSLVKAWCYPDFGISICVIHKAIYFLTAVKTRYNP